MFLYGGLISSRISYDSLELIEKRLQKIVLYKEKYPNLKIYLTTVIMRIPAYNLAVEEPDYWEEFGKDIFDYSFYRHKYEELNNKEDRQKALEIKKKIPTKYLEEFLWRRERNHELTKKILTLQKELKLFESIYITLDDNAPYGLNIKEEKKLRKMVNNYSLEKQVNIYPGADEVGLTVLAKAACDYKNYHPKIKLTYRDSLHKDLIPNYEGQALAKSIYDQIIGADGKIGSDDSEIILFINNFSSNRQLEAIVQPDNKLEEYDVFKEDISLNKIIGLADLRYSNGGDKSFFEWFKQQGFSLDYLCYAGWNTNGNSLGTVIANCILLYLFSQKEKNVYFNTIRILEDILFQAEVRNELVYYVEHTGDLIFDLRSDLEFYVSFVKKRLNFELNNLKKVFHIPYKLTNIDFPWLRCFEIGIYLEEK